MPRALKSFSDNFRRVKELGGLHSALSSLTTSAVDSSDLLRAQIVLGVSALDHFVHELTVQGMLEVYDGSRPTTDAFAKFRIPLVSLTGTTRLQLDRAAFESSVREALGFLTFQQPEKIADAVRLFSAVPLWNSVASQLSIDAKQVKNRLQLIVDRRNKIAHEADVDPSYPGVRWPISPLDVGTALDTIEQTSHAIDDVVR